MHIKDRGNTALPTDIVKVLKTQDENYIRTMRAAGLKVCSFSYAIQLPPQLLFRKLTSSKAD